MEKYLFNISIKKMFINLKKHFTRNFLNIPGWRTNRKIVVIESDDWGSIRMPSKEVYDTLIKKGIKVDKCSYNSFDSLESESDITALYEVLTSRRDKNGKYPIITANSVIANPDFEKIEKSGFQEYYFEPFAETYKRYPNHAKSFQLIQEGIKNEIFYPQFHGREHLNVSRWMFALQNQLPETRLAFQHRLFGLSTNITTEKRKSYLAAMDYDSDSDQIEKQKILKSGLVLFESIYGYKSESFIAPNYIWGDGLLPILIDNGVKYIQGVRSQSHPNLQSDKNLSIRHTLGERNHLGQLYLIRNCFFEPTLSQQSDPVDSCMRNIQLAFFWKKPAIISAHRLNFIGEMDEKNRSKNLKSFYFLLSGIVKKWPNVEFMTSDKLGNLICATE
ncbi:MAG: hypothetical protein NTY07_12425 [Bacteroidia bacterium]|nr:hypothetical protein [Bacteroidia bacterium]